MKIVVVTDIYAEPAPSACLSTMLTTPLPVTRFCLNTLCRRPDLSGEALHHHLFKRGGMTEAVSALRKSLDAPCIGLGYSAGGTTIWQATVQGAPFRQLFCLSSTRLRDEAAIATPAHVFFGADDENKPSEGWLATVPERKTIVPNAGHTFYLHPESKATQEACAKISRDLDRLAAQGRFTAPPNGRH